MVFILEEKTTNYRKSARSIPSRGPVKKRLVFDTRAFSPIGRESAGKPVVFNNIVYFTTYAYKGKATGCSVEGDARLYELYYVTGGSAVGVDDLSDIKGEPSDKRYKDIGTGVPSNPVISVDTKGQASLIIGTTSSQVFQTRPFFWGG